MAVSNATLLAKIDALEKRVTALAAKVKADETASAAKFSTLNPLLTSGNLNFLANLGKMGFLAHLTDDPFSGAGPNWQTGERDYVNSTIDKWNSFQTEMVNQGFMFPS
jgi:hypothetical protein